MEIKDSKLRYCIINPESGRLTIKLWVSEYLLSGADFKVFAENKSLIEQFKLSADSDDYATYFIKEDIQGLNKAQMAWNILFCSNNPKISEGQIKIDVIQNQELCKMTIPAEWNMKDIPPCAVNNPISFTGSLIFIHKTKAPF